MLKTDLAVILSLTRAAMTYTVCVDTGAGGSEQTGRQNEVVGDNARTQEVNAFGCERKALCSAAAKLLRTRHRAFARALGRE